MVGFGKRQARVGVRGGRAADGFVGAVDQVQVKQGIPSERDLMRTCSGADRRCPR
ncbi:hypothetical protein NKG05_17390 [Oerskovia sp. M15]